MCHCIILAENYILAFLLYFSVLNFLLLLQMERFLAFPYTTVICPLHSVEGAVFRSSCEKRSLTQECLYVICWICQQTFGAVNFFCFNLNFFWGFILPFFNPSAGTSSSWCISCLLQLSLDVVGFFLQHIFFLHLWAYILLLPLCEFRFVFPRLSPEVQTNVSVLGLFLPFKLSVVVKQY